MRVRGLASKALAIRSVGNRTSLAAVSNFVPCGTRDLLTDPLGSLVREIASGASLGSLVEMYPYGTVVKDTGTATTPFVFVAAYGYYTDSASRDYVRARELMKSVGRWLQVDPYWPKERAIAYARHSPVQIVDPTGRNPLLLLLLIGLIGGTCAWCAYRTLRDLDDIDLGTEDKRKHCVMACMLRMRCGEACGLAFVIGTEAFDLLCRLLGGDCHPSVDDVMANVAGHICGTASVITTCLPWIFLSPRGWCEACCKQINYGQGFKSGSRPVAMRLERPV